MKNPYSPNGYRMLEPVATHRQTRFDAPDWVIEEGKDYRAVLETSKGRIVVDLFAGEAPTTVNNFVFLSRQRYYDGVVFHRVLDDFMAQTGDPTGTGRGGPGYEFADETGSGLRHDRKGIVSMANAGPDTNGSQFFITFRPTPHLDGRHTVFGAVIEGGEVLDEIQRIDPQRRAGAIPDKMESVYILERED